MRFGSIYKITNLVNGKIYIGQTVSDLKLRWAQHKSLAKKNDLFSPFMCALRKYGHDAFVIEEVAVAFDRVSLDIAEDRCIAQFGSLSPAGYNLCIGNGGHKHSEETKIKIRAHVHSDETRRQMSESQTKRYQDPEARKACARIQSKEERAKRSATMKRIGHTVKRTPESLAKMAASKRGQPSGKARPITDQYGVVYTSITDAAQKIGVSTGMVSMVINGKKKSAKGHTFTYLAKGA